MDSNYLIDHLEDTSLPDEVPNKDIKNSIEEVDGSNTESVYYTYKQVRENSK